MNHNVIKIIYRNILPDLIEYSHYKEMKKKKQIKKDKKNAGLEEEEKVMDFKPLKRGSSTKMILEEMDKKPDLETNFKLTKVSFGNDEDEGKNVKVEENKKELSSIYLGMKIIYFLNFHH